MCVLVIVEILQECLILFLLLIILLLPQIYSLLNCMMPRSSTSIHITPITLWTRHATRRVASPGFRRPLCPFHIVPRSCMPQEEQQQQIRRHGDMLNMMAVRTAEIDEHILSALRGDGGGDGDGGVRQVALLGAGLDARAWRLPPLLPHPPPYPDAHQQQQPQPQPPRPLGAAAAATTGLTVADTGRCKGGTASSSSGGGNGSGSAGAGGEGLSGGGGDGGGGGVLFIELDSGSLEGLKLGLLGEPPGCRRAFQTADLAVPEQVGGFRSSRKAAADLRPYPSLSPSLARPPSFPTLQMRARSA
jgi:uncharacterized membrane protein YgcG